MVVTSRPPIMDCLEYLGTQGLNFCASRVFLSSKFNPCLRKKDPHGYRLRGIIPGIINHIMSFTNLSELRIKEQGDGSNLVLVGKWRYTKEWQCLFYIHTMLYLYAVR